MMVWWAWCRGSVSPAPWVLLVPGVQLCPGNLPTPLSMGMLGAAPRMQHPNLSPGEFPARGSISSSAFLGSLMPNSVTRSPSSPLSGSTSSFPAPYQHHGLCSELAGAVQGLAARSRRWHGEPGHLTSGD